jgi:glutathione S-transferase
MLVEESGRFDSSQWSLNSFAEFTKLNPFQTVPVLEIDGAILVDSVAILLVSLYPNLFYTYVI